MRYSSHGRHRHRWFADRSASGMSGANVKALVRAPGKTIFPAGVTEIVGDLTNISAMRSALSSVRTLYLLNAVVPDEVTQALITLTLAHEAGIERDVNFSRTRHRSMNRLRCSDGFTPDRYQSSMHR